MTEKLSSPVGQSSIVSGTAKSSTFNSPQQRTVSGGSAFRVSDRSGTPQAGNPAEEYSGERDPAAFEPEHAHISTPLDVKDVPSTFAVLNFLFDVREPL